MIKANKFIYNLILIKCVLILTISCTSYEQLNDATQDEYDLRTESRLMLVQFYVDGKFGYEHESSNIRRNVSLESGSARSREVLEIERKKIIIDKNTPGVCVSYDGEIVKIDFGDGVVIPFVQPSNLRYASFWKPDSELNIAVNGETYIYDESLDGSLMPKLVFDGKALRERMINEEERKASGRRLE